MGGEKASGPNGQLSKSAKILNQSGTSVGEGVSGCSCFLLYAGNVFILCSYL